MSNCLTWNTRQSQQQQSQRTQIKVCKMSQIIQNTHHSPTRRRSELSSCSTAAVLDARSWSFDCAKSPDVPCRRSMTSLNSNFYPIISCDTLKKLSDFYWDEKIFLRPIFLLSIPSLTELSNFLDLWFFLTSGKKKNKRRLGVGEGETTTTMRGKHDGKFNINIAQRRECVWVSSVASMWWSSVEACRQWRKNIEKSSRMKMRKFTCNIELDFSVCLSFLPSCFSVDHHTVNSQAENGWDVSELNISKKKNT